MAAHDRNRPQFFLVPPAAPSTRCRHCGQEVYWIVTRGRARWPIDCSVPGGLPPVADPPQDGSGIRHWCTRPEVAP